MIAAIAFLANAFGKTKQAFPHVKFSHGFPIYTYKLEKFMYIDKTV